MTTPVSTVARAFELARSGTCQNTDDIRKKLKAERYDSIEAHLSSASLSRQLRALIKESRAAD